MNNTIQKLTISFIFQDANTHLPPKMPAMNEVVLTRLYFNLTGVFNQAYELRLIDISFYRSDVIAMPLDSIKPLERNVMLVLIKSQIAFAYEREAR